MSTKEEKIHKLEKEWKSDARWKGLIRPYNPSQVVKLQGSLQLKYTLAEMGAKKLWKALNDDPFIRAMGALTGNQAVQQVQAGLKAIYCSGWQVAADANDALHTYPDLSLYPHLSAPHLIQRINNAFLRADQIQCFEGNGNIDWFQPIIADAEAGFGGPLNVFELTKAMIESGVSGIHFEDQLSSLKKCGHMGGKVLVPAQVFIEKLVAARLAADVLDVPTLIIARTDAEGATYITSIDDPSDAKFVSGKPTIEGYHPVKRGVEFAVARACRFAPYCDMLWCETDKPDLGEAKEFAEGVHAKFPGKWLAYNCSPSFNWSKFLSEKECEVFQEKLASLGYRFQFITLAGFHTLNASMFELSQEYQKMGMRAYAKFQEKEFQLEKDFGYKAIKHQSFVGASYFDEVLTTLTEGKASTHAMKGSTEEMQFHK